MFFFKSCQRNHQNCSDQLPALVSFSPIVAHCPKLVHLDLTSVDYACNHQRLCRLVRRCPELEDIVMSSCYEYDEPKVLLLLRHLPRLRRLELPPGTRFSGKSLALVPKTMRLLRLPCGELCSTHVRHLARCRELRQLELSGASQLTAEDLAAALSGCGQLEELAVGRLTPPPERYLPPAGLAHLATLDLQDSPGVSDITLRRLPQLTPALTVLCLQGKWRRRGWVR